MDLSPFALERYFARREFTTELILCASDCETLSVEELLSLEPGARQKLLSQRLGYTESAGSPALREAVSALYRTVSPQGILVHPGAEEAIFLLMHAALRPGDHLVVHAPCYQSLGEVPRSIGCEVSFWRGREEQGWRLEAAELERLLRKNTRLIVLNSPHNPTGWQASREQLREIADMAEKRGITLFSDEVYRGSEYRPEDRLPAACDLTPTAVSLGVLSKTYGLPGLRIGWLASHNAGLLLRVAELKDYTTICASAPSELLAEIALRHADELAARSGKIIAANLRLLDGFFQRRAGMVQWQRPAAGPIAFPRLASGDADAFCERAADKAGVLLLPVSVYGEKDGHFRIGFGRRNMPQALARLEEFLDSADRGPE
jgi:aspartate/methionine/tyrosine aminotransferase